jgi:hypothetical protein
MSSLTMKSEYSFSENSSVNLSVSYIVLPSVNNGIISLEEKNKKEKIKDEKKIKVKVEELKIKRSSSLKKNKNFISKNSIIVDENSSRNKINKTEINISENNKNNINNKKNDNNNNNNGVHDIPFLPSNHNMRNTNIKINIKKNKKRNRKLKKKNDESDHSQTLTYENQNKLNYQNNLKNQRFLIVNTNNEFINNLNLFANNIVIYHNCFICNKTFSLQKLYNAECYKHFTCRRCTKNYFEEKIEEGEREFFCPVFKCNSPFNIEILKDIISKNYYNLLTEKTNNEDKKTNDKLNTNTILTTNNNNNKFLYEIIHQKLQQKNY